MVGLCETLIFGQLVLQLGQFGFADPIDLRQLINASEWPVLIPIGDDALREGRADARQCLQLFRSCLVEMNGFNSYLGRRIFGSRYGRRRHSGRANDKHQG